MRLLAALIVVTLAPAVLVAAESKPLRFAFGTIPSDREAILATPVNLYNPSVGFGVEPGSKIVNREHDVTSPTSFLFSVKLPEGNYRVTVTLSGGTEGSMNTVKAEARRLMLENVPVAKTQTVTRQFCVNVRTPRIREGYEVRLKQRERDTEMVTWDDKLTLEFNGVRPGLKGLEIIAAPEIPTVFVAGDSTVCDQPQEPWNSWGQMLPRFFKPEVAVANYAQSGESIKSSLGARRFEKILSLMKPGDWLLIQFGHNDMKDKAPDALTVYAANLKKLVAQTRIKGGTPVLITSMERKAGVKAATLGGYPDAVRAVAREEKVALIDLHAWSIMLYQALGGNLDRAFQDGTHHNNYGSYLLAKCVAAGIEKSGIALAKSLVPEVKSFDPAKPDPFDQFTLPASPLSSTLKPDGN